MIFSLSLFEFVACICFIVAVYYVGVAATFFQMMILPTCIAIDIIIVLLFRVSI